MPAFAYLFERFPSFTQTFCYREVMEVGRKGIDVEVFSIRRPNDIPVDCPEELTQAVYYLPEEGALRAETEQIKIARRLPKKAAAPFRTQTRDALRLHEALWLGPRLRERGIGHVHVHFAGIAARTAFWLKRFYGITYSFTAHANDVFCDVQLPVTQEDLFREASLVVTVSDFSRDWLRQLHPRHAEKIVRVYNGIDTTQFRKSGFPPGTPHLVSVGRCIEKKGFADLIDACAFLRDRGVAFACSIVGSGPLEDSLRAQIAERKLEGIVRMTGPMAQEAVRSLLSESHLFVLACAREHDGGMDNLPTVIAEAMSSGLPVVSTRLAGVPEMVEDGVTGLLVGEHDPAGLAGAIESLLADLGRAKEYGARGIDRAAEQFAAPVTTEHLIRHLSRCRGVALPPPYRPGRSPLERLVAKVALLLNPRPLAAEGRAQSAQ